jgi:hypothetical protein
MVFLGASVLGEITGSNEGFWMHKAGEGGYDELGAQRLLDKFFPSAQGHVKR